MNVLHIAAGNMFGGVETCLIALAHARKLCPEMTHEFAVCFEGRLETELRETGAAVHRLAAMRASRPWTVWNGRRRLERLLDERPFGVIVFHSCWCYALLAGVARRRGVSRVLWGHNDFAGKSWEERLSMRAPPAGIIANSRFTADSIGRVFPSTPFRIVHSPLSPPRRVYSEADRAELRAAIGVPDGAVAILQVSRMEAWKGHRNLLDALAKVSSAHWLAIFAGGAQRESELAYLHGLQRHSAELKLSDRVRFLGQRNDVPDLMNAADIFCQPNAGPEPFGLVFVEALYACRPVVSFAFGGAAEIVDETCGLLAPPGNIEGLAQALQRLIDDPTLRHALGKAAPARAAELCEPVRILHDIAAALKSFSSAAGIEPSDE